MLANAVPPAQVVVCALGATLAGWVCGLLLFLSPAWQPVELAFLDRLTVATAPKQALPITLLSDNIQETFGIVPVKAMAVGLPVVVSVVDDNYLGRSH